ncbi:hypothetical protein [Paenibacillus macerans]|uniref:hypothetical protein n=1 Tax=Paenibacillus macerans TaxID=44252 RepID=UPI003D314BEB
MRKFLFLVLISGVAILGYFFLSNNSSSTPIKAIEKARLESNVGQLLNEIEIGKGKVVFLLRDLTDSQTISAEYVRKTFMGWKWGYGGGHTFHSYNANDKDSFWSQQYLPSTKGTEFISPYPLLFGVITDHNIDSISVHSYATNENLRASIINTKKSEEQGGRFEIFARSDDNQIISSKILEG